MSQLMIPHCPVPIPAYIKTLPSKISLEEIPKPKPPKEIFARTKPKPSPQQRILARAKAQKQAANPRYQRTLHYTIADQIRERKTEERQQGKEGALAGPNIDFTI